MVLTQILYETNVRKALRQEMKSYPDAFISDVKIDREEGKNLILIVVRSPYPFTAKEIGNIESKPPKNPNQLPVDLRLRHIKVEVLTKEGSKFDLKMSGTATGQQTIGSADPS